MKKIFLMICLMSAPLLSNAQDAFYASGLLGMTTVTGMDPLDLNAELSFGLRAGVLFNDHVAVGLYLNRYATDTTYLSTKYELSSVNIMGEISYYINEADENGFWISGLLGVTQAKNNNSILSTSESETAFGASLGYHFMVAPNFSLGPQLTWVKTSGDADSSEISGMVNLTVWL